LFREELAIISQSFLQIRIAEDVSLFEAFSPLMFLAMQKAASTTHLYRQA